MGKKGATQHLKRLAAPAVWPIHRKEFRWVIKPDSGPHSTNQCLPLLIIVRDILGLARTRREAKIMLSEGQLFINGKVCRSDAFPIGLMDVIDIPAINKSYRVLPVRNRALILHPIQGEEKSFKLYKILNKTSVTGRNMQLNLNNGDNVLVRFGGDSGVAVYNTSDLLKIGIPGLEILGHVKFGEGVIAIATGGANVGRWGRIVNVKKRKSLKTIVTLEDAGKLQFRTTLNHVFVVGDEKPWISLPEDQE